MKNYRFTVKNLDCANCAKKIEDKIASYDEYKNVQLNFATLKLSFQTEKEINVKEDIQKIISGIEPNVEIIEGKAEVKEEGIAKDVIRLVIRNNIVFYSYVYTNRYSSYSCNDYCIHYSIVKNCNKGSKTAFQK